MCVCVCVCVCLCIQVSAVGAFGVEKVSMSPLSQAVRDKVQKSMEKSRGSSPPSCHEDANSREFEAAAASEEEFAIGGSGKRKVGQEEEEDAVIEDAVLQVLSLLALLIPKAQILTPEALRARGGSCFAAFLALLVQKYTY